MKYFQEYEKYRKKKEYLKEDTIWYWLEESGDSKSLMEIIDVSHNVVRYRYAKWRFRGDDCIFSRTLGVFLECAAPYIEKESNETI
jgi:hypothetical protein